jgi:hypothetical protein
VSSNSLPASTHVQPMREATHRQSRLAPTRPVGVVVSTSTLYKACDLRFTNPYSLMRSRIKSTHHLVWVGTRWTVSLQDIPVVTRPLRRRQNNGSGKEVPNE